MNLRYKNFIEDSILESIINESFLYFSPTVKSIISRLSDAGNAIAQDLKQIELTDIKLDVTFIDLDKNEDYLTFITMKNAKKLVNKVDTEAQNPIDAIIRGLETKANPDVNDYLHRYDDTYRVYSKSRNSVRIGKLINKLFPNKYTSAQVEEFVNSFKSIITKFAEHFEIIEGDDIAKWYDYNNYKETKGTLGKSCMSRKSNKAIFDIYTKNPGICRMLILVEEEKLIGRALLWKLTSIKKYNNDDLGVEYFLDRVYTIKDSDVIKFQNYAKDKGWAYKSYNNHHSLPFVNYKKEEAINVKMTVQLANEAYQYFPYVDTFRRFDPDNYILYNDADEDAYGSYLLQDTNGGYEKIRDEVYSDYYDEHIPLEDAVYSDYLGSHIYRNDSVRLTHGRYRDSYLPDGHDDVVYCRNGEICTINEAVYSDIYNEPIYLENAIKVVDYINADAEIGYPDGGEYVDKKHDSDNYIMFREVENTTWYKYSYETYEDIWDEYEGIMKNILYKNYKNEWIPKKLAIKVSKVRGNKLKGVEYLKHVDASVLGVELDESQILTDEVQYDNSILPIIKELETKIKYEIQKYKDIIAGTEKQTRLKFSSEDDKERIEKSKTLLEKLEKRYSTIGRFTK